MNVPRLTLLLALVSAVSAIPAHSQVGIYGKFETTHYTAIPADYLSSSGWFYGAGAGIYYDFIHLGPVALGADLRGNLLRGSQVAGNQQKFRSGLFGLRLALKAPLIPIKPYVQGSVGVGGPTHNNFDGTGTIYSNKFEYQVLGGIDLTIFPHLDWRVAEVGYGRIKGTVPTASVFTAGTGLVLRLF